MNNKIFRDDDISHTTDLALFKRIHNYFKDAIILHTIALIVKDIETNSELIDYIKSQNIDVQLHCYSHYKLTDNLQRFADELPVCIETIERLFGEKPTVLYPTWNEANEELINVCKDYDIKVNNRKVSLDQYLRCNGDCEEEVINFHYWAQGETILLEPALEIYNTKR